MEIFPEIGPQKIFLVPPNSAPGLRPCLGARGPLDPALIYPYENKHSIRILTKNKNTTNLINKYVNYTLKIISHKM